MSCSKYSTEQDITASELQEHVVYLASDVLAGRETATPSIALAEEYIADQFAEYGLRPIPDEDDFFLEYTLYEIGFDTETSRLYADFEEIGVIGKDFKPFHFSGTGTKSAEMVFAGYGITAPELGYDDYEGIDVEGKFVFVLRHEPEPSEGPSHAGGKQPFSGEEYTRHAYFTTKAENAERHGAVGMILVTDPLYRTGTEDFRIMPDLSLEPPESVSRSTSLEPPANGLDDDTGEGEDDGGSAGRANSEEEDDGSMHEDFLALHVSQNIAATLLKEAGVSLMELQKRLNGGVTPREMELPLPNTTASINRIDTENKIDARNVAGYLPGKGKKRNELIVIGAHHDHLGSFQGEGDTVYNGADDNGSGVAAVLELAEAFSLNREKVTRSILFMTFSGEEEGLLGSEALFQYSLVPEEHIVIMLNFDMIGRNPNDPIDLFHFRLNILLDESVREFMDRLNEPYRLPLSYKNTGRRALSDYYPFEKRDIPVLYFFTGLHSDYHQVTDHADKLDYTRMEQITELSEDIIFALDANMQ